MADDLSEKAYRELNEHREEVILVEEGPLTALPSGAPFLEWAVVQWCRHKPNLTSSDFLTGDAYVGPYALVRIVLNDDGRPEVDSVTVGRGAGEPGSTPRCFERFLWAELQSCLLRHGDTGAPPVDEYFT